MGCTQAKIEPEALTPDDTRIIRETWKMVGREAYGEYGQRLMLRYVGAFGKFSLPARSLSLCSVHPPNLPFRKRIREREKAARH